MRVVDESERGQEADHYPVQQVSVSGFGNDKIMWKVMEGTCLGIMGMKLI